MKNKLVCLIVLDGWGIRFAEAGNAVAKANTVNYCRWLNTYESSILDASGEAVGLTHGQMGNSEVGHLNIGTGRIIYQSISKIDRAIETKELHKKKILLDSLKKCKGKNTHMHLVGLLGPGGVHSHINHLLALIDICSAHDVIPVLHLITDGRDTPPQSALSFYEALEDKVKAGQAIVGTIGGRYYYMDRDNRWERTSLAYNTMIGNVSVQFQKATDVLTKSYNNGISDEFVVPVLINADGVVRENDSVIFFNFRADRMRQLVRAFSVKEVPQFPDKNTIKNLTVITMTQYEEDLPVKVLFPKDDIHNPLARVLSDHGLKQFHIAETEKYAHVTYFFNGGHEDLVPGEEDFLVPSPKVATYDLMPEMSARKIADKVIERLGTHNDSFILINFANPDMVGHSGNLDAAIKAVECVDQCAGTVVDAVHKKGGVVLIIADHGNAELMVDVVNNQPHTYHTTSPVPFIFITDDPVMLRPRGILADVAPTILQILDISPPEEFTGESLWVKSNRASDYKPE